MDKKTEAFEGAAQRFGRGGAAAQPSFARLNGEFGQMLSFVESADTAPTMPAQKAFAKTEADAAGLAKSWGEVKAKDIPALNEQLRKANLPTINLTTKVAPEEESAGDDEP